MPLREDQQQVLTLKDIIIVGLTADDGTYRFNSDGIHFTTISIALSSPPHCAMNGDLILVVSYHSVSFVKAKATVRVSLSVSICC